MICMQGDPLVQHLPADAQLRITALKELEGDQRNHVCATSEEPCQTCSTAPPVPSPFFLGPPLQCHPIFIPMCFLHCMHLENPSPDEGEMWVWRCGSPESWVRESQRDPYRVQPLHLHIILAVEVHADSDCLNPRVICVAGVIKIPLVYLRTVKECNISRGFST